jgi:hypothetical protein
MVRPRLRRYVRTAATRVKLHDQKQRGAEDQKPRLIEDQNQRRTGVVRVPPPCPPGWQTGAPDYVGVGTQKAGTTWWNLALSAHPQVHCPRKEVHFFEDRWNEALTEVQVRQYHQYFPRPVGMISGEWTPRYMLDPWTPGQLHQSAPGARILILLRDPIARLRSGLRHMAVRQPGTLPPQMVNEAIAFGRYGEQLDGLLRHFPREQILVLQFERCLRDPQGELARTFAFLGVDPRFVPEGFHQPVNEGQGPVLSIPADLIDRARELYVTDTNRLSYLAEIDLGLWPELTR